MWCYLGARANMADDIKSFSIVEEGCLRLPNPKIHNVVYHKSLNILLAFGERGQVFVLDIASGTVLHDTFIVSQKESNKKSDEPTVSVRGKHVSNVPMIAPFHQVDDRSCHL